MSLNIHTVILLVIISINQFYSKTRTVDDYLIQIKTMNTEQILDTTLSKIKRLRNSNPRQGVEIGLEVLSSINTTDNDTTLAKVYNEIGISFRKLGEYNFAIIHHFNALKIFKKFDDQMGEAFTLHNIGNVYRLLKQYDISLQHLFESVRLKNQLGDLYQISFSLNTIGLVYEEKGILDSAEVYMKKALKIANMQDNKTNLANIYSNLGSVEAKFGKYDESEMYLMESLKMYRDGTATYGIIQALGRLGELYTRTNQYNKALKNLNLGLEKAKEIQAKELEKELYFTFSEYYRKIGKFKEASSYLKKYIEISNNLSDENKIKQVTQTEFIYHLGEKVRENEVLKQSKQITELKYSNQKILLLSIFAVLVLTILFLIILILRNTKIRNINQELIEKEKSLTKLNAELNELNITLKKLFTIIAHDLRNPFNFLILSSSMMLERYGQLKEEEKLEMLNGIETVSKESFTLLSNLLEWSRLQTGKLKAKKIVFPLFEAINKNVILLSNLAKYKNITINNKVSNQIKVYADIDMIDTVIRNLITNAIKFSKPETTITISASESIEEVRVCVEDQGIGMDEETKKGLFNFGVNQNRVGTNNETGSGLGLSLSKELVEENGGTIWPDSQLDIGTKIFFTLPRK